MVADPPPPLQTHPHMHTMREKRRYNGALRILAVFRGRASQPASQGGGRGGGFQSLPATQPRLGAAPVSTQVLMLLSSDSQYSIVHSNLVVQKFQCVALCPFNHTPRVLAPQFCLVAA